MELSCEVRGPLWVPRKARAGPFKRTSSEAEPTWLEPDSAAAKEPSGRGISEPVPGRRSTESEGTPGPMQSQELEGASHSSRLFPQVCPYSPTLPAIS